MAELVSEQAVAAPGKAPCPLAEVVRRALEAETRSQFTLAGEAGITMPLAPLRRRATPCRRPPRLWMLAPRLDVGGGARILLEHANRLGRAGFAVTVASHFPAPDWFTLTAGYRRVPLGVDLGAAVGAADLVVAGYWSQVLSARLHSGAPVVHFEQGDFHLYEELEDGLEEIVAANLRAADATYTLSRTVASLLDRRFGVHAEVIPNAVDTAIFHAADGDGNGLHRERRQVLAVGWDGRAFKGIPVIREAIGGLRRRGYPVHLTWVTPEAPVSPPAPQEAVTVVVNPAQATLAQLYRNAAVYVCGSRYETFPLPPLEAMACGTPVVTTTNAGSLEYSTHGGNALHVPVDDAEAMADAVAAVLDDSGLADRLRHGGLQTAREYCWDDIIGDLASSYRQLAGWRPTPAGTDWTASGPGIDLDPADAELLADRLRASAAASVALPVSAPFLPGLRLVRWRVVATNPCGAGQLRLFIPARSDAPASGEPWDPAWSAAQRGETGEALATLAAHYTAGTSREQATIGRYMAVLLLAAGRLEEAIALLELGRSSFPDHADYYRLGATAAAVAGEPEQAAALAEAAAWLGPAARYDEWFAPEPI